MTNWICLLLFAATPPGATREAATHDSATPAVASSAAETPASPEALSQTQPAASPSDDAAAPKSARQLRQELHQTLRSVATETGAKQTQAIRRLVDLHGEIARDTQFTDDDRLAALRLVRNRLKKVGDNLAKTSRKRGAARKPPVVGAGPPPLAVDAQTGQPIKDAQSSSSAAALPLAAGAGGGGQGADEGEELVELIQRTIAPQTWEANGGLGVIRYYAQGQALVVRQSQDALDELGEALQQLRK